MSKKNFTAIFKDNSPILIHIPHSSIYVPKEYSDDYLLSNNELDFEKKYMADLYTDELFGEIFEQFGGLKLNLSRIFLDVERFRDDKDESMSKVGMGLAYSKSSKNRDLRSLKYIDEILKIYDDYHKSFSNMVDEKLSRYNKCIIIDCHSFPDEIRWYESEKEPNRAEICLGFEEFHKDKIVLNSLINSFEEYDLRFNSPFLGSIVPLKHYKKDKRVKSIMIELNRKIYMDENNFEKIESFEKVKRLIKNSFESIPNKIL